MPRGKFDLTNQKHYSDEGSDASSVWNFCARFSDVYLAGKPVGASPNVGCILRLPCHVTTGVSLRIVVAVERCNITGEYFEKGSTFHVSIRSSHRLPNVSRRI